MIAYVLKDDNTEKEKRLLCVLVALRILTHKHYLSISVTTLLSPAPFSSKKRSAHAQIDYGIEK